MNRWPLLSALLSLTLILSCQSEHDKREAALAALPTPLAHDPTDDFEIARWWSNGTHLLRLDENAFYSLYRGNNRYATPLERGHWGQTSFAVLILEPYNRVRAERIRVGISRIDGELALTIPKLKPMKAIDRPPSVVEDRLVGAWEGEIGVLRLNSDGSYSLALHRTSTEQPVRVAGHEGAWSVAGNDVTLKPRTPGLPPIRLPFNVRGDIASLGSPAGPLVRLPAS